jgi:hypothetical protein
MQRAYTVFPFDCINMESFVILIALKISRYLLRNMALHLWVYLKPKYNLSVHSIMTPDNMRVTRRTAPNAHTTN